MHGPWSLEGLQRGLDGSQVSRRCCWVVLCHLPHGDEPPAVALRQDLLAVGHHLQRGMGRQ